MRPTDRSTLRWLPSRAAASMALALILTLAAASLASNRPLPGIAPVVITVNGTGDVADFAGMRRVADLPGPDGVVTLREAALASTNTPGPENIAFDIPTSDPGFIGTVFEIRIGAPIELGGDDTILDGTSQPGGHAIAVMGDFPNTWSMAGLTLSSSRSVVRGLKGFGYLGRGLEILGDDNVVESCSITGPGTGILITGNRNRVGGTEAGAGCVIRSCGGSGVVMTPAATANLVEGSALEANGGCGLEVEGTGNMVGGSAAEARNVIGMNGAVDSQGYPVWPQVWLRGTGHVVKGNFIGVDATGMQSAGRSAKSGILVNGSLHTIGGAEPGAGNLISGHDRPTFRQDQRPAGIRIVGATSIVVRGNRIGTDAAGAAAIPNQIGIRIEAGSSDIVVGGGQPGDGNQIAFNLMDGLAVQNALVQRVRISRNSMFGNGLLGIDLGDDPVGGLGTEGVTANDPGDADTGTNQLQNYPSIALAISDGLRTQVHGSIDTANPQTCVIELFSNDTLDPSGHGEGDRFLVQAIPDGGGTFTANLPDDLIGRYVSATATDILGNTSEFSPALRVEGGTVAVDPSRGVPSSPLRAVPNPFRDVSRIELALGEAGEVDLRVFDVLGQEVSPICVGTTFPAGRHTWTWNGVDHRGRLVPAGVYFIRARAHRGELVQRLIVLR